jgi:hypothetical protein
MIGSHQTRRTLIRSSRGCGSSLKKLFNSANPGNAELLLIVLADALNVDDPLRKVSIRAFNGDTGFV